MAPELTFFAEKGQEYSTKVDVWGFGVMLYEMFTGQKPFLASSMK